MNYLLVVQVFVRTPSGSLPDGNQQTPCWRTADRCPCALPSDSLTHVPMVFVSFGSMLIRITRHPGEPVLTDLSQQHMTKFFAHEGKSRRKCFVEGARCLAE